MRLLLLHPGVLRIDCADCQRYIYDLETGERKTYRSGSKREQTPMLRPAASDPPCHKCPKKGAGVADTSHRPGDCEGGEDLRAGRCEGGEILRPRHWRTLAIYQKVRATMGVFLTSRMRRDALLMRNLAAIDELYRQFDRRQLATELAHEVALLFKR